MNLFSFYYELVSFKLHEQLDLTLLVQLIRSNHMIQKSIFLSKKVIKKNQTSDHYLFEKEKTELK